MSAEACTCLAFTYWICVILNLDREQSHDNDVEVCPVGNNITPIPYFADTSTDFNYSECEVMEEKEDRDIYYKYAVNDMAETDDDDEIVAAEVANDMLRVEDHVSENTSDISSQHSFIIVDIHENSIAF